MSDGQLPIYREFSYRHYPAKNESKAFAIFQVESIQSGIYSYAIVFRGKGPGAMFVVTHK